MISVSGCNLETTKKFRKREGSSAAMNKIFGYFGPVQNFVC